MNSDYSEISDYEMDLNDQIIRQLKNITVDNSSVENREDSTLRNIVERGLVKDFSYDYVRGKVEIKLSKNTELKNRIENELLELGWVSSVNTVVEDNEDKEDNSSDKSIEMKKCEEILTCLRKVIDPDLNKDIVSCNFVKDLTFDMSTSEVSFTLELTTPICPLKESFEKSCIESIKNQLEYVGDIKIKFSFKPYGIKGLLPKEKMHANLEKVSYIVAISSCKGGVGKSTFAVNIAYSLSQQGAKVGLVDCDIYGPNLEQLVPIKDVSVFYKKDNLQDSDSVKTNSNKRGLYKKKDLNGSNRSVQEGFVPIFHEGVQLMSYSYLLNAKNNSNDKDKVSSILRGPIAGSIVTQLITGTLWNELDYLILDLPPGTGDIQLSIAQNISIDGAIIITTPQDLSIADVERGIHLFNKLNIPILTLIENMSYFICDGCDKKHEIFSRGDLSNINDKYGLESKFKFPLNSNLSKCRFNSDSKKNKFPFVLAAEEKDVILLEFKKLSEFVVRKLSKYKFNSYKPKFEFDNSKYVLYCRIPKENNDIFINEDSKTTHYYTFNVSYSEVRKLCRCAICFNPLERNLRNNFQPSFFEIDQIESMGTYAVSISWSDGHNSIISYNNLIKKCCFNEEENIKLCQQSSLNW